MSDAFAIRAENLGKRFLREGWQADRGMHKLADEVLRMPLRLLGASTKRPDHDDRYFWALRGISFEAARGEVIGLVGPNGAGKSVLLKLLSRVTQPTEGFAEIRGEVGSLLEGGAAFHPDLTGRENLYLSGNIFGMPPREVRRKLDRIVAFAEIDSFLDTAVKHYSSGMILRLAMAIMVHLERRILFIDEVLATGDESFRQKCIRAIHSMAAEGRTILFVSHDPGLVSQVCHRCLYLEKGRISDDGPTAEILSRYGARVRWKSAG